MVVCQDIPILSNDEAGAFTPLRHHSLLHPIFAKEIISKKFFKKWIPAEWIAHYPLFDHRLCVNIYNSRRAFLDYRDDRIAVVDILCVCSDGRRDNSFCLRFPSILYNSVF